MKYLFYLESYTFLLCGNCRTVVYNTLNGAYLICPECLVVQSIIEEWKDTMNGYGTLLDEQMLKDDTLKHFIEDIRESFSGDCVEYDNEQTKPYLFQPTLFLNTDIRVREDKKKTSLGNHIIENLHEVNFYLPSVCKLDCSDCTFYYHQMNHCTINHEGVMKIDDYHGLLYQLQICGVQRVNLLAGGNPLLNSYICNLSLDFTESAFKKHLYLEYNFLNDEYIEFAQQTNSILEVSVHPEDLNNQLTDNIRKYHYDIVRWNLIVSAETDMEQLDNLDLPEGVSIKVRPFYTGSNYAFFRDFVFSNLEDILAVPIDRKTIFRHKVLNDNFFGKLTVFPSGEVFANVNCPALGNIQESSLKELVYKELTEQDVWLRVRSKETPCKQCINKDLCPSISNYELVIGKNNLCNIQPE